MKLALSLQLLLLAYHQLTTLVDFYPFNGIRFSQPKERFVEAATNFVLMALGPVGYLLQISLLMRFGAAYYFILFACEVATWFVPYFFGASPKWQEIYGRVQGQTIMVLPRRGPNPTPNLEHLILMAITAATAAATLRAYRSLPNATSAGWPVAVLFGLVMIYGVASTHWRWTSSTRAPA